MRTVKITSGETVHHRPIHASHFGEGLTVVGDRLLQLTWKEGVVYEYKLPLSESSPSKTYQLPCTKGGQSRCHEGWGLAYDSKAHLLYLTDSTDKLFTLDADTLAPKGPPQTITDKKMGRAIFGANELELVDGELWANIFPMYQGTASECIARINPKDASVLGWIDMRGLLDQQRPEVRRNRMNYVLNGIAYNERASSLYVTGKQWDKMYQVRILPDDRVHQTAKHVSEICSLGDPSGRRG